MSAGAADKAPCDGQSIQSAKMLSIGYAAQPVVRDICVDFPAALRKARTGEKGQRDNVFGFVGPNGAGKTTLLKTCLGLLSPLGGELRLLGVDTRKACFAETRKKLAYIPQNRPEGSSGQLRISVREAVSFGRLGKCGLTGRFNRADREAVEAAILYCGLETLPTRRSRTFREDSFSGCRSRAPWRRNRRSTCSTNLVPTSTRKDRRPCKTSYVRWRNRGFP